jgi:hypothetical protein
MSAIALGFKLSAMLKTSAALYSLHRDRRTCYRRLHFRKSRETETVNSASYRASRLSVRETWCHVKNCGSLELLQFSTCVSRTFMPRSSINTGSFHSSYRCIFVQMLCSLRLVSYIHQPRVSVSHLLTGEELVMK